MSKNSPSKGHHGLGARGQGKLLYFHTQIPQTAVRRSKEQLPSKGQEPHEHRKANGRWSE